MDLSDCGGQLSVRLLQAETVFGHQFQNACSRWLVGDGDALEMVEENAPTAGKPVSRGNFRRGVNGPEP